MKRELRITGLIFLVMQGEVRTCGRSMHTTIMAWHGPSLQNIDDASAIQFAQRELAGKSATRESGVLALLEAGRINPCAKGEEGVTLAHLAARYGSVGVTTHLVTKVKVPLEADNAGKNPLHWAVGNSGHPDVVKLLLTARKDQVVERDIKGREPFFYVSSYDGIGDMLLAAGASVDGKDRDGRTPLFYYTNPNNTAFLCSRGANPNHIDGKDLSILGAYLAYYFNAKRAKERKNEEETSGGDTHESCVALEQAIQTLVQYGAVIPHHYHPANGKLSFVPGGVFDIRRQERASFLKTILKLLVQRAQDNLVSLGRSYTQQSSMGKLRVSDNLQTRVYDAFVGMIPFLRARHSEAEIMDTDSSPSSSDENYEPHKSLVGMLTPFSAEKADACLLPTLIQLFLEYECFEGRFAVNEGEKQALGMACLIRLFPSVTESK